MSSENIPWLYLSRRSNAEMAQKFSGNEVQAKKILISENYWMEQWKFVFWGLADIGIEI